MLVQSAGPTPRVYPWRMKCSYRPHSDAVRIVRGSEDFGLFGGHCRFPVLRNVLQPKGVGTEVNFIRPPNGAPLIRHVRHLEQRRVFKRGEHAPRGDKMRHVLGRSSPIRPLNDERSCRRLRPHGTNESCHQSLRSLFSSSHLRASLALFSSAHYRTSLRTLGGRSWFITTRPTIVTRASIPFKLT